MIAKLFKQKVQCNSCNATLKNTDFLQQLHLWQEAHQEILELDIESTKLHCEKCLQSVLAAKCVSFTDAIMPKQANKKEFEIGVLNPKQSLEGIDYYIENGFYVFTKWHHLKRGYCCKNKCRHCAYGYAG